MAKQYGLILPNKSTGHTVQNMVVRPSIFNEESDSDSDMPVPGRGKRALKKQEKLNQEKAVVQDPTVFQYDEIYEDMDKKRKESKLSRQDLEKKPKYIGNLLVAAGRRKRENERRIERQVQKEREAEGEEFKDKESFVTLSYRKKLEEMQELEEQEKREEYLESIGDVKKQGNLDGFYRHIYEQKLDGDKVTMKDGENSKTVKEEPGSDGEKSPAKKPRKSSDGEDISVTTEQPHKKSETKGRKYRQRNDSNNSDDEKIEEKVEIRKEHLPSNLDADSDFSIDSSDSEDEKENNGSSKVKGDKEKPNETTKNSETVVKNDDTKQEGKEKPEEKAEPIVEEVKVKKPKVDIWKKRTVGSVFDEALKRYYERKALHDSNN